MNNQDVMTMWAEALRLSNDARFEPSGKGASVHGIFAALVLEKAAQVCDITPPEPFRPSIEAAHALRQMAKELRT